MDGQPWHLFCLYSRRNYVLRSCSRPLRVAVLTVSDTRTLETDKGGNKVQEFLEQANHIVAERKIVIDDYDSIRNAMIPWCNDESIDVIISTGGTGIACAM